MSPDWRAIAAGWPPAIRLRVEVARKTAARLRHCTLCGKRAVTGGAYCPPALRQVLIPDRVRIHPYALCGTHAGLDEDAIGHLLAQHFAGPGLRYSNEAP